MSEHSIEMLAQLFSGHSAAHGTHGEPYQEAGKLKWEIKKTALTVKEPISLARWQQHVAGTRPLGVIPIREDSKCVWGSIDVDEYGKGEMLDLVKSATEIGLVAVRSKSGGLHLLLFLEEWTMAATVQGVLRDTARRLGLKDSVEIFPKQTQVDPDRGDLGNWIIVPYFGGSYGGKLKAQVGIKPDGTEMSLEEFTTTALAARLPPDRLTTMGVPRKKDADPLSGAPACLRRATDQGVSEQRNETLFNLGVYARQRYGEGWKDKVSEFNHEYMRPPLPLYELNQTVKSLDKKDYSYRRGMGAMCVECADASCQISGGGALVERIIKITTKPPHWTVYLRGGQVLENLETDQLLQPTQFIKECLEKLNLHLPPMSKKEWYEHCKKAGPIVEVDGSDIGDDTAFQHYLEDFLTNQQRGKRIEDLLGGRPWEDEEGRVFHFCLIDLMRHINHKASARQKKIFTGAYAAAQLRDKGGVNQRPRRIAGKPTRTWTLPSSAVERTPTLEPMPMPADVLTERVVVPLKRGS